MAKPLEIFLFNGCRSAICERTYDIVLPLLHDISMALSEIASKIPEREINVVISGGRTIRGMNRRFRKIDSATDVLSFPMDGAVLGEVWLCPSEVEKNARAYDQDFETELVRVLVHGVLHLLGYDHTGHFGKRDSTKEPMFEIQETIVTALRRV